MKASHKKAIWPDFKNCPICRTKVAKTFVILVSSELFLKR